MIPVRSLPRVFVAGADASAPIPLPDDEWDKLRKVLRLGTGDEIAVLPGDGSLIRCVLQHKSAEPTETTWPATEPVRRVTLAQALPKGDRIDDIVRSCTELGVARFVLFPSDRTVVRWEGPKLQSRLTRLRTIAREAAEQSYRTRLPEVAAAAGLSEALVGPAIVLSEVEGLVRTLSQAVAGQDGATLVVGPEGGWSPRELAMIGNRGVTLGPRVLRVDTAAIAACSLALLGEVP